MQIRQLTIGILRCVPGGMAFAKRVHGYIYPSNIDDYSDLDKRSNDQLMAIARHEAHRIEKSIYNNIFESKKNVYVAKRNTIQRCLDQLSERGVNPADEPTMAWAIRIVDAFGNLGDYIDKASDMPAEYQPSRAGEFSEFVSHRRSCRVWADEQPSQDELLKIADKMVDAARWAPTSGNRQPWRFIVITDPKQKELLRGIKENHCVSGPLLIWVLMDARLYGALGNKECSLFIDAGAAIMQMVLAAHSSGLGVCWNHFAADMINSRASNVPIYERFASEFEIAPHMETVAIVAIGRPEFLPPPPARMDIDDLVLHRPA